MSALLILDLTPGCNGLGKDSCKTRRQIYLSVGIWWPYIRGLTVYRFYDCK